MLKVHNIRFYRNPVNKVFWAVCSCGWTLCDSKNEDWVRQRAAVHDLDNEITIEEIKP